MNEPECLVEYLLLREEFFSRAEKLRDFFLTFEKIHEKAKVDHE